MIWLPVAMLGCLASLLAISVVNVLNWKTFPDWIGVVVNLVPAFICGVWCYYRFARRQERRSAVAGRTIGHLARAAPLYAISVMLGAVIVANYSEPGFGLVAQLFVWPLMATVGGILGVALAGVRPPHENGITMS
jgi:hypothetical protein